MPSVKRAPYHGGVRLPDSANAPSFPKPVLGRERKDTSRKRFIGSGFLSTDWWLDMVIQALRKHAQDEKRAKSQGSKKSGLSHSQDMGHSRRPSGLADVNPHDVGPVPPRQTGGHTGRGWHGPNAPLAPRGDQTIYDVRDHSAPRGGEKFGDPYSVGGRSRLGPRGRFVGHGPHPRAGGPGGSSGVH